jgi:hypothetical protein
VGSWRHSVGPARRCHHGTLRRSMTAPLPWLQRLASWAMAWLSLTVPLIHPHHCCRRFRRLPPGQRRHQGRSGASCAGASSTEHSTCYEGVCSQRFVSSLAGAVLTKCSGCGHHLLSRDLLFHEQPSSAAMLWGCAIAAAATVRGCADTQAVHRCPWHRRHRRHTICAASWCYQTFAT